MSAPIYSLSNPVTSMDPMEDFDRLKTDFHALNILVSVHRLASVSTAAEALGLNQSTVSYALERLRQVFGDPLFVRVGKGIVATQRCDEVVRGAGELLHHYRALVRPAAFDPGESRERLTISCNFYERLVLLPGLVRRLRREAPHVRLSVIQSNALGHEQLLGRECDLLISPLLSDTAGLYMRPLFEDRYACFVDEDSVAAREGLTLETYARSQHVLVNYAGGWQPFYRATLKDLGVAIDPAIELPSFGSMHLLLKGTDLVLTAPAGLAPALPGCVRIAAPFDCRFTIHMFWNGRVHDEAMNRWLRTHVAEASRALPRAATGA